MGLHTLRQCLHEARLAQSRLSDHEDDLAHPLLSLLPPIFQQTQFGIPTRERRERKGHATFGFARTAAFGVHLRLVGRFAPLRFIRNSEEIHGIVFGDSEAPRDNGRAAVSLKFNSVEVALLLIATWFGGAASCEGTPSV